MSKFKKSIALLLVVVMILPISNFALGEKTDISNHWAKEEIQYLMEKGIINGYPDGTFRPEKNITRAEFYKVVNELVGYEEKAKINFEDVKDSHWFYEHIQKGVKAKYIKEGKTLKPNVNITREEVAEVLSIVFDIEENLESAKKFKDYNSIPENLRGVFGGLTDKKYLSGYPDGTVRPKGEIKRSEAVKMIHNVSGKIVNLEGRYTEDTAGNVLVNTRYVILIDMHIKGDLYLTEGIGKGDATLDNVIVEGKTYIKGGGENSITITNSKLEEIAVKKEGNKVRVVIGENTDVSDMVINENTILVIKKGGKIKSLKVIGKAKIEVEKGAEVGSIEIESKDVEIKAEGNIGLLVSTEDVNVNDKIVEKGSYVNVEDGKLKEESKPTPVTSITVTAQDNISEISTAKGSLQMLVEVKPTTATNKNVDWSVTNLDGSTTDLATMSTSGLLTAVKNGKVKVRATSIGTPAVQGELVIEIKGQILPSTIIFEEASPIAKIVGDKPFINKVTGGEGKGAITYTSGTPATATVNKTTGEVTIVAAGSTVITATKAATETHGEVTNTYTINVTKTATTALTSVSIIGKVEVGQELTADLMPKDATATYQWIKMQKISSAVDIPGATTNKYTPVAEDEGWRIMIMATGIGNYSGTVNDVSKPVSAADIVKTNPIVNQAVAATKLNAGETLAKSTLSGTFKNASNQAVAGKLTWTAPTTVVHSSGNYSWTFTPADTLAYNVIKGEVKVTSIMSEFAGGDGTKASPYEVATAQQLDNVRKHADKFFIQTADINLGVAPWNSGEGWEPIGSVQRFSGSYDGNAYKISGLTINTNDEFMGLFRTTEKNAQLTKISLVDVNIKGGKCTGGLVANHTGGTISECYVTGSVTGSGNTTGGLVGQNVSMLRDSYASCVVTGVDYVGGLVGNNTALGPTSMGVIKDCYATGLVKGNLNSSGGLVGRNHQTITASYYDMYSTGQGDSGKGEGKVTEDMIRAKAFSGWDFDSTWRVQASNSSYPYFKWQTNNIPYFPGDFAGGSGTSADPYQVATAKQLDNVRKHSNRFFIQTADINLDVAPWNSGEGWEPIGSKSATSFKSNYNGNGFKISGLTINRQNTSRQALFERLDDGGSLMNIHLREVNITGRNWVAPLVAANYGGDILRCSATGYVHGRDGSYVGGLVGWHGQGNKNALISESYSTCTIGKVMDGRESNAGGLVGTNNAKIDRSFATGTLNFGLRAVGGLVGFNTGQITNCYSTGEVNGLEKLGGVVGENTETGLVDRCYAVGKVEKGPWGHQAGIVGYNDGTVTNCYYDKETTGRDDKGKGEPKTTKEMKTYSTFKNWSFQGEYWRMSTTAPGSYPYFSWQGATLIPR